MALRPRAIPSSIVSRYDSQALEVGLRPGGAVANSAPKSVITSLAGFAVGGSRLTGSAALAASESVITPLAGFAGVRPHLPGGRKATPAAFKYVAAVSRRTPVARWMRRSDHPSRPNAMTCCLFSSLKTLLTSSEGELSASLRIGRQSANASDSSVPGKQGIHIFADAVAEIVADDADAI